MERRIYLIFRPLMAEEKDEFAMRGVVVKSTGSWYEVRMEDGTIVPSRLKGKFRLKGIKSTNPVAVGDVVSFVMEGEEGVIVDIDDRKNYIIRRSINLSKQVQIIAANIDQAFLLVTVERPLTTLGFIDRFLVGAEAYRIPVTLLFNKIDQYNEEELERLAEYAMIYEQAGYEWMTVSALSGQNVEKLKERMQGKVSLFSGHSGVGKSTLVNWLDPSLDLRTAAISEAHSSGMHTTTFAEMFPLSFGGHIIDTPGIKGFGNVEIEKEELSHYFPEMRSRMQDCKFHNCVHINEPGCAIKAAVEEGEIMESRYANYLAMYEDDETETYRSKGY